MPKLYKYNSFIFFLVPSELLFLISRYLAVHENESLQVASQYIRYVLETQHSSIPHLPLRLDWLGNSHPRQFHDGVSR